MEPRRIVSLVPSHTESLFELGLGDRVVGRTRFCLLPTGRIEAVPHVGGTKDPSMEKTLALEPDLVVVDKDENPKPFVEELREAGVEVLHSEIESVPDAATFLERLADRCGVTEAGAAAAAEIRTALAEVTTDSDPVPVWCPVWYDPWMTFDGTTYPSAMLAAVGLRNVFADHDGPKYFTVEAAKVATTDAAWTLLPSEPYPFHKRRDKLDLAGLGPAGTPERIHLIEGEALTWFGTRTARGLRTLALTAEEIRAA